MHGALRFTYAQLDERAKRLASALARHGVRGGDTVSAMLEAHFGIP